MPTASHNSHAAEVTLSLINC